MNDDVFGRRERRTHDLRASAAGTDPDHGAVRADPLVIVLVDRALHDANVGRTLARGRDGDLDAVGARFSQPVAHRRYAAGLDSTVRVSETEPYDAQQVIVGLTANALLEKRDGLEVQFDVAGHARLVYADGASPLEPHRPGWSWCADEPAVSDVTGRRHCRR